jgi:hypothetical protein
MLHGEAVEVTGIRHGFRHPPPQTVKGGFVDAHVFQAHASVAFNIQRPFNTTALEMLKRRRMFSRWVS